ncbi:3019_t:CDS:1, partial [Gigaspora rosea]
MKKERQKPYKEKKGSKRNYPKTKRMQNKEHQTLHLPPEERALEKEKRLKKSYKKKKKRK